MKDPEIAEQENFKRCKYRLVVCSTKLNLNFGMSGHINYLFDEELHSLSSCSSPKS